MLSIFRKEDDIQNKCYKLNSLLHFQHLFTWPKHITNITQIKRVGLQLAQNGQFDKTETDKVIKLTSATISFGYDVSSIVEIEIVDLADYH